METKETILLKIVFKSPRHISVHQDDRHFSVQVHQRGGRDVTCKRSFNNYCKIISFNSAETIAGNHFNLGRMGNSSAFVWNGMYFRINFFYLLEQGSSYWRSLVLLIFRNHCVFNWRFNLNYIPFFSFVADDSCCCFC